MPVSIPEFWKLTLESRLLAPEHCQQLAASYEQTKGALGQTTAKALAEWLISINVLSKYQATVLLNGRSGPFYYGEYKVYDRIDAGRWKGAFRAVHAPTNHPVLLQFVTGAVTQDPQHWAFVVGQVHNRLTASFPHWHRYFEVVDLGNFKFLVAEDLAGDSLDQRLAQVGRIAPQEACVIVRHVALALAAASPLATSARRHPARQSVARRARPRPTAPRSNLVAESLAGGRRRPGRRARRSGGLRRTRVATAGEDAGCSNRYLLARLLFLPHDHGPTAVRGRGRRAEVSASHDGTDSVLGAVRSPRSARPVAGLHDGQESRGPLLRGADDRRPTRPLCRSVTA